MLAAGGQAGELADPAPRSDHYGHQDLAAYLAREAVGVDDGALLLSPQSLATGWRNDVSVTLTRVDTRGRKLGIIEGVTAPDLKHWERPKQR